ncbi:acylphosphatase [Fulvivirga ligni]|uniref:acylphosphatase n=1 Tax=Fulvivirga ligni TaxID=2904246 RepID=UPI001F3C1F98|nr:acylphosphatase [Fulvivirga ligni]UII22738.1 acylphosphatase [Fulvivirga ligni]
MKHLNIQVKGLVQGVFFRKNTKIEADKNHIKGWVRNEMDGSVYLEAEGEEENFKIFLEWLHHAPEHSIVNEVVINEGNLDHFDDFQIRY